MFNVVKTIPPAADSLIVLFRDAQKIKSSMQNTSNAFSAKLASDIEEFLAVDNSAAASGTHLVLSNDAPGKRIILAPIGNKLYSDTGDVRDISSAARGAVKRAIASGSRNPVMSFAGIQGDESLQAGSLQAKLWQTRYSKIIEVNVDITNERRKGRGEENSPFLTTRVYPTHLKTYAITHFL